MTRTGLGTGGRAPRFTVADLERFPGLTAIEQAKSIGCSVATVFALRAEVRGGPATSTAPEVKYFVADLAPYMSLGYSAQLAALDCGHTTLARLRREAGLTRRLPTVDDLLTVLHLPNMRAQATALGCSPGVISRLHGEARAAGIEIKNRRGRKLGSKNRPKEGPKNE